MPKTLDKSAEASLLGAIRHISDYVEKGASPTEAVVKAASEMSLGPHMVPLAVHAYNTGRTTWQQNHGGTGILDKQANFPIARVEDVMRQLYPDNPATPSEKTASEAISKDYSKPPSVAPSDVVQLQEKAAHYQLPKITTPVREGPLIEKLHRAFGSTQRTKRASEVLRMHYKEALDKFMSSLSQLNVYFKQSEYFRKSFAEVEYNAQLVFGEPAKRAMDHAYAQCKLKEKRASGPPRGLNRFEPDQQPYNLIAQIIKCGEDLITARKVAEDGKTEVKKAEVKPPFEQAPASSKTRSIALGACLDLSFDLMGKEAGFLGNLSSLGLGAAIRGGHGASTSELEESAEMALNDPSHLQELREIETRATLNDLISNDEIISGYDPDEVLDAYNEIAQLSPRASGQPAVIRPLLRRRLTQGALEPFEAQQMADIEKTVGGTTPPQGSEVLSGNQILK